MDSLFKTMPNKTVLVTGAEGFTGKYIVPFLMERDYHVIAMGLGTVDSSEAIQCDLSDARKVHKVVRQTNPDFVIHLAGMSFVGESDSSEFYRINLFGTLNLIEGLAQLPSPPKKVLIASSANVYGNLQREVIDESVCPVPVNHYAISKLAMEFMVRTWFEKLPIIITRPFNYTGPGQDERFLIPKIVAHFHRKEKEIRLGNTSVSRDFSNVLDIVVSYVSLMESNAHSLIVNVCSGMATSIPEIIATMNIIAGYAINVKIDSGLVRENEITYFKGSNDLLKKIIGFAPSIPLSETLLSIYKSLDNRK